MSESFKLFKDPVYGYVRVPERWVSGIVDTPAFQRLRRISQTSYAPLFPSATHNRFVHSLGVFHLGTLAAKAVSATLDSYCRSDGERATYDTYVETFRLACLLHDIGHAPFSHTGESFYKDKDGTLRVLHERLSQCVAHDGFQEYCQKHANAAAPHEVMSSIIGLSTFPQYFQDTSGSASDEHREFFARAITGYCYDYVDSSERTSDGAKLEFLNCLIKLLNSSIIDVDRLDYLIRDAFQTGYKTLSIDHERLLGGISLRRVKGVLDVVYTKQAISVLENVVYAHDAERKWVQSHPSIIYEMDVLKHAIRIINSRFAPEGNLFCEDSLTEKGLLLNNGLSVRYFSDDDVVFFLKNERDPHIDQYLDRRARFRPLWKSEVEYNALFGPVALTDEQRDDLSTFVRHLATLLAKTSLPRLNEDVRKELHAEMAGFQKKVEEETDEAQRERFQSSLDVAKIDADFTDRIEQLAETHHIKFDFVFHAAQSFASGFGKSALRNLPILLDVATDPICFCRLTKLLNQEGDDGASVPFYVFCERLPDAKSRVSAALAFSKMMKEFVEKHKTVIQRLSRKLIR